MAGPRATIQAPTAAPPRISLIGSAVSIQGGDTRWQNGLMWLPENCGAAGVFGSCAGDEDPAPDKMVPSNAGIIDYAPFIVWAGDQCTAAGMDPRDWQARAERLLEACQHKAAEAEFWSGELAQDQSYPNDWLSSDEAVTLGSGAQQPADALSMLEDGLASCSCGGQGMIHATRGTVTQWDSLHLLRREGARILTVHDTVVVPGAGYDGSGPSDTAATDGHVWAYATGMVYERRGEVVRTPENLREATDRQKNTITYMAERFVALTRDECCHLAVEVDAPAPPVTGS